MAKPLKRPGAAPAPASTPAPAPAPAPVAAEPARAAAPVVKEERRREKKPENTRREIPEPSGDFTPPTEAGREATKAKALAPQTASKAAQTAKIEPARAADSSEPYGEIEAQYYAPSISARPAEGESVFGLEPYLKAVEQVARLRREEKIGPIPGHIKGLPPLLPYRQPPYISERTPVTVAPKQSKLGIEIFPRTQEVRSPSAEALDRPLIAAMELMEVDRQWRGLDAKDRDAEKSRIALEAELKAAKERAAQAVSNAPYMSSAEREVLRQKMNREIVRPVETKLNDLALSQRRRTRLRAALEASRREYGVTPDIEALMAPTAPTAAPETAAEK